MLGCDQVLEYQREVKCRPCEGSGAAPNSRPKKCYTCGGSGTVSLRGDGKTDCDRCDGTGTVIKHKCTECDGQGRAFHQDSQTVTVPMGVADQHILRLERHGHIGTGQYASNRGDIIIRLAVADDNYYTREGLNIVSNVYLSVGQAVLGTQVRIDSLKGEQQIDIPGGTQHDTRIRLQAQGIKQPNKPRGHHFLKVQIVIPQTLGQQEQSVYSRL